MKAVILFSIIFIFAISGVHAEENGAKINITKTLKDRGEKETRKQNRDQQEYDKKMVKEFQKRQFYAFKDFKEKLKNTLDEAYDHVEKVEYAKKELDECLKLYPHENCTIKAAKVYEAEEAARERMFLVSNEAQFELKDFLTNLSKDTVSIAKEPFYLRMNFDSYLLTGNLIILDDKRIIDEINKQIMKTNEANRSAYNREAKETFDLLEDILDQFFSICPAEPI